MNCRRNDAGCRYSEGGVQVGGRYRDDGGGWVEVTAQCGSAEGLLDEDGLAGE